ncbi:MAG: hypothetical protein HKN32_02335 [Flavobacteriales bacterium]|nr:hypothetical protein [Flavobacteriales bacterium]
MKFQSRLNRYLIGLAIGFLLVAFIFRGRDWGAWLPNAQVLKTVQEFYSEPSQEFFCLMECHNVSMNDMKGLMQDGDVAFGDSQTKGKEKEYIIHHKDGSGKPFTIHWQIVEITFSEKVATPIKVYRDPNTSCDC